MSSSISFVQKQLTFKEEIDSTRTVYCKNNSDEVVVIVIRCSDRRISLEAHTNGYPTCLDEEYYMDPRETLEISVKFKPSASCTNDSALIKLHSLHDKYDKWIKLLELPVRIISEMGTPQLSMEVVEQQGRDKPTPLQCSICSEAYAEDSSNHTPRILKECGHTVCERCARGLMNRSGNQKIKCPHDQRETKVENEDIENLPRNFEVLEVLRETPKVVFVPCGEDPSHQAVLFCTSCLVDFCEKCFEQVHSSKTLSKHQKVPISEKPIQLPKCPTHPYNNAEFLCKSSECGGATVICHTCILGHHKEHPYEPLMEKLIENKKRASDLLEKLESARKNYIEKLTVANDNRASFSTGNQEFKQKSEEISKYFKQKEEEAIQNLRDYCSVKGKYLDERIEELKKDSRSVHDLIEKIDSIWKTKKDLHLVEEMNEKVMKLCELSVISEDHQPLDQSCISWKDGIEAVFQ